MSGPLFVADVFVDMVDVLPETLRVPGRFYITHVVVDEGMSQRTALRGELMYCPPGRYAVLKRAATGAARDTVWMSDTRMERLTNAEIISAAYGDVLLVGLGLGLLAVALCRKPEVTSVVVLELEPEVVALVAPHLRHPKLQVILADGKQPPLCGRAFDTIYLDIWPTICSDNWEEMRPMLVRYRTLRRAGGVVTGWMKDYVQREYRKEA